MNKYNKMCSVIVLFVFSCFLYVSGVSINRNFENGTSSIYTDVNELPDHILTMLQELQSNRSIDLSSRMNYGRKNKNSTSSTPTDNRQCVCDLGVCKCCTGLILEFINQKACLRVTYHPGDFAFDVAMTLNDRVLYEKSMSGKNPKPMCISPPRINNLKLCAKFYNVFFPGRNFHFCLAMTGHWRSAEMFNIAFDCLRMGANGIAMVNPEQNGGLPIPNPQGSVDAVVDSGDDDIEEYDENVKTLFEDIFDR